MKYNQPIGAEENASYVDAVPEEGIEGSPVPASAIEHAQREIVHVIEKAGLVPDASDLTQLYQAIGKMVAVGMLKPGEDNHALFSLDGKLVWRPTKHFLTAPLTMYLSPTGDDSKNGLTKETAKKTLSSALDYLKHVDSGGFTITILVMPGHYGADEDIVTIDMQYIPSGITIKSYSGEEGDVRFNGQTLIMNTGTLAYEKIQFVFFNNNNNAVLDGGVLTVGAGATVSIAGCEIQGPAQSTLLCSGGGTIQVSESLMLHSPDNALRAILANIGGAVTFAGASLSVSGNYTYGVIHVEDASLVSFYESTAGGAATGVRYRITTNGIINTRGGGEYFLPGSATGTKESGGQYV